MIRPVLLGLLAPVGVDSREPSADVVDHGLALADRSHLSRYCLHQIAAKTGVLACDLRRSHPRWDRLSWHSISAAATSPVPSVATLR